MCDPAGSQQAPLGSPAAPSPEPEHMIGRRIKCAPHRGTGRPIGSQCRRAVDLDQSLADLVLIFVRYNSARRPNTHISASTKVIEAKV